MNIKREQMEKILKNGVADMPTNKVQLLEMRYRCGTSISIFDCVDFDLHL